MPPHPGGPHQARPSERLEIGERHLSEIIVEVAGTLSIRLQRIGNRIPADVAEAIRLAYAVRS
jgi:hypothetical protein